MTATVEGPSAELVDRWKAAARGIGLKSASKQREYAERWSELWESTRTEARRHGNGSWSEAHLALVTDYVEARRAASEYEAAAAADPFPTNGAGRPMAHPGIAMAQAARREAREVLAELIPTPAAAKGSAKPDPDPSPADAPGDDGDQAGL